MMRSRQHWLRAFALVALSAVLLTGLAAAAAQNPPTQPSGQSAPTPPSHPPVIDPRAQQLLDKVIQALGGQAFLQFKTMTSRGRAFTIADESTAGLAIYVSQVEYPDKRRFTYGTSKPVVLINNGDQAWELDKFGVTSQFPEQAARWKVTNRYSLENLLRLRLHEPGVLVQMGGVDFVDNLAAQIVEIVDARQVDIKLFINPKTFLPLRITYQVLNPKTHEQDEYADVYSDYRTFQGVQTPLHITRFVNDERLAETYRNSVKYDETYPPETFATPGR